VIEAIDSQSHLRREGTHYVFDTRIKRELMIVAFLVVLDDEVNVIGFGL
jgi:hypothetical protein